MQVLPQPVETLPLEARARIVSSKLAMICRAAEAIESGSKVQPREVADYIRDEVLSSGPKSTRDEEIEAELKVLVAGARAVLGE